MAKNSFILFCLLLTLFYFVGQTRGSVRITSPDTTKVYTYIKGNVTITCQNNEPIDWYITGAKVDPLSPPADVKIENKDGGEPGIKVSTLHKTNIQETDADVIYNCGSTADGSTASRKIQLIEPHTVGATAQGPRESVEISCRASGSEESPKPYTLVWSKNNSVLDKPEGKYSFHPNNTLRIENMNYSTDLGIYHCSFIIEHNANLTLEVVVNGVPFVHKLNDRPSVQLSKGSELKLKCNAEGYPEPVLSWEKDELPIEQSMQVTITDGNSSLSVANLDYNDRGVYFCFANSGGLTGNSSVLVRVKNPYAALWPVLGIVIEVIILVVIIVLYELKRKRDRAQDQKEETQALTEPSPNAEGSSDVRKRTT